MLAAHNASRQQLVHARVGNGVEVTTDDHWDLRSVFV
jgi:hypothetical protein